MVVTVAMCLVTACSTIRLDTPRPTWGAQTTPVAPAEGQPATVTRVIDGDTIVLSGIAVGSSDAQTGGHRARLIGIDTPEVHGAVGCFGREASTFTRDALDQQHVRVAFDVDTIDRYGRALVYVWQPDGSFFNARLVAEGYAVPYTFPPNVRYASLFVQLAGEARKARRGLWSLC